VAFPLISAGAYGWPVEDAIRQAVGAIRDADYAGRVTLVLWQTSTYDLAARVLAE
jgi:O-acetyl-ADP-ribose deacetylase (regulator of RNase III)